MKAHIYKTRTGKFQLILTTGPEISSGVISTQEFASKPEAKKEAKIRGAQPWNY